MCFDLIQKHLREKKKKQKKTGIFSEPASKGIRKTHQTALQHINGFCSLHLIIY